VTRRVSDGLLCEGLILRIGVDGPLPLLVLRSPRLLPAIFFLSPLRRMYFSFRTACECGSLSAAGSTRWRRGDGGACDPLLKAGSLPSRSYPAAMLLGAWSGTPDSELIKGLANRHVRPAVTSVLSKEISSVSLVLLGTLSSRQLPD
jgi:hypothetical protein